jgi:hypothetical protein
MAQVDNHPPASSAQPRWLDWMVRERQTAAYVLFGVSALFWVGCVVLALLPRWLEHEDRLENFFPAAWAASLGLVTLGAGLWYLFYEPDSMSRHDAARVVAIGVGGLAGFLTTLLGLALAWQWWDDLTSWLKAEQAGTGLRNVAFALAAFFGGLAVMFLSLQLARTRERANATSRRLLYGYNAVLMGVLLLAVLLVANVMVYAAAGTKVMDFTSSQVYSLSSRAKNVLQGLKEPTQVFVVMSRGDPLLAEVLTLLDNCRAVNDTLQVSVVGPDSARAAELARTYPDLQRDSLLVVYGSADAAPHSVINREELAERQPSDSSDPDAKPSFKFKGEDALISKLDFLEAGKQKAVVYFTQGNGELELSNSQTQGANQGIGLFRDQLEKRNYTIKSLQFTPGDAKIPEDAALVVIVRPLDPWPEYALKALGTYMNPPDPKKPKGRLLILFGLNPDRAGHITPTGLEAFVSKYNVRVTDKRILSLQDNPFQVLVRPNPRLADQNPVAAAFARSSFWLTDARLVEPSESRAPGGAYDAQVLFAALVTQGIWAESNLQADATQLSEKLQRDREALLRTISRQPLSVAVAVTETKGFDPHAFMRRPEASGEPPRLVVFGDANLVTNRMLAASRGQTGLFEVVVSCMDWLRGRPQSIGIEPKKRDLFTFNPGTETVRMALLPGILMLFGVVGLGAGVWLVRRR